MSRELAKRRLVTVVCNQRSGGGRAGRALPKVVRRLQEGVTDAELHVVIVHVLRAGPGPHQRRPR